MKLRDKVVIITGSSSGIGQHVAIRFAKAGARVVINYHKNRKGARETLKKIQELKREAIIVKADVTRPTDVINLFRVVKRKLGRIDILINNAGIGTDNVAFMEAKAEHFQEMMNVNLIGPMLCSQSAIRIMQKQGYGKILFTSSIRGIEYGGKSPVYAATKAGINSFTKTLAKKLAPTILVNAVAPGSVKTRTYDKWSEEYINEMLHMQYLKRFITKDEIADAFLFVAKNDAMTGQVIYVDGGYTLK